jgi:hypothetical protein
MGVTVIKILVSAALLVAAATAALADDNTALLVARAWPYDPYARVSEVGRGVGIVFTPDLSVPGNCRFYDSLGFACFEDADWSRVLDDIRLHNIFHPENRIRTLILETHGTNGNGLKLQRSHDPKAERSYVSVGALQERLEPDGVRYIIISACNSGRLMRPSIYRALDPDPGDKLFLPPTCGIVSADAYFDPARSRVTIITPGQSHIETSLAGSVRELAPVTRKLIADSAKAKGLRAPTQFAVSDLLMAMLLRDPRLSLTTTGYVDELSKVVQSDTISEGLYTSFVAYLNGVAAREMPSFKVATTAKPKPRPVKKVAAAKSTGR